MAQTSTEITEKLFEAVDTIIGERITSLPYDQTIVAQIVSAEDHANGIYIVTHDYNTNFTAYADYTGFQVGDYVYVRIPEGDYTKQKVITGKYLEGLITSSETHNILASEDVNYYVYDKNNLIHNYVWSKEEHEIVFTYFNSIDATKDWKDVLNTYTGGLLTAERPKAIKLTINDIVVYLHKYREDPTSGNSLEFFAAEQEGVTLSTFIPDVEQGDKYFSIRPNLQWHLVTSTEKVNPNVKYYTRTGTNTSNYVYTLVQNLEEFEPNTNYYIYADKTLPIDIVFYQKDESNQYVEVEDLSLWDGKTSLYYHNSGELELVIPKSLPMLQYISVYYNEGIHIKYKIAPEYVSSNSNIFIQVQFCPIDETYNVSNDVNITFGYLTELEEELNPVFQLIRAQGEEQDIVQAVVTGESTNSDIKYSLKVLLIDKNGNYVESNKFQYKWDYYLDTRTLIGNEISENNSIILDSTQINSNNKICYKVDIYLPKDKNNAADTPTLYRTCYYPLAFSNNLSYFVTIPTIIKYNQSGTAPEYFNSIISLGSYSQSTNVDNYIIEIEGNSAVIDKNVLIAYNYLNQSQLDAIKIIKNNKILWYQTILFIQDKQSQNTISRGKIQLNNSEILTDGALIAKTNENTGLIISKTDNLVELNGYNKDVNNDKQIFHLDSNGNLVIGYNNFTMTGHITEGATYLENSNKVKYTVGNNLLPVYFSQGIPVKLNSIGSKTDFIYLTSTGFQSKSVTSAIENHTSNFTLTENHNSQFLDCTQNLTINFPSSIPIGFECEIYNDTNSDTHKILFQANNNNIKLYCSDTPDGANKLQCVEPRGVVVAKYIKANHWLLSGSVEENT